MKLRTKEYFKFNKNSIHILGIHVKTAVKETAILFQKIFFKSKILNYYNHK